MSELTRKLDLGKSMRNQKTGSANNVVTLITNRRSTTNGDKGDQPKNEVPTETAIQLFHCDPDWSLQHALTEGRNGSRAERIFTVCPEAKETSMSLASFLTMLYPGEKGKPLLVDVLDASLDAYEGAREKGEDDMGRLAAFVFTSIQLCISALRYRPRGVSRKNKPIFWDPFADKGLSAWLHENRIEKVQFVPQEFSMPVEDAKRVLAGRLLSFPLLMLIFEGKEEER